ncbi:kinase-like domain-containing protein [Pisolithus orientalis]|uniref:kinase-like domain-containing protein n=1 Tax=Pisolithus orientalis TaxID=936130 RepID=UPI0022245D25|nr:kinase-like domain-containing protein [Pisolithus orientalis]KAI5988496.1 kinase-like domain-containing protein [Pisolithus orientalis]
MTPQELLHSPQARHLCPYAREEMFHHSLVYFIGTGSQKKQADPDIYLVVRSDHLAYRYEVVDALGNGSFGQVLNCRDHRTGESVAIKLIRNKKRFHHQDLDQRGENHVVKMTEHFYFCSHLCIAMELLSINLYELIKANRLVGLHHHLDTAFHEPDDHDVLLKHPPKSAIKVIDFGSTCFEHEKSELGFHQFRRFTFIRHTQSQCYPSLEVILGINYHVAIDMWNPGCILAELYTGFPIFPGENEQEQLVLYDGDNSGAPRSVVNFKGQRRGPERRMKPQAALQYSVLKTGHGPRSPVPRPRPPRRYCHHPAFLNHGRRRLAHCRHRRCQCHPRPCNLYGSVITPYRSSRHSFCRTLGGFAVATAK